MASLKEVRTRISSVTNTRKITSAMKLVASSKLYHAQRAIEQTLPYTQQLEKITTRLIHSLETTSIASPFAQVRPKRRILLVAVSSNSSMCGAFNANVVKQLREQIVSLQAKADTEVVVLPIGRKVAEASAKLDVTVEPALSHLLEPCTYTKVAVLARELMNRFLAQEFDEIRLIYNHFVNTASQMILNETYLPISNDIESSMGGKQVDYIVEPSTEAVLNELISQNLELKLFTTLLDSFASEQAARVVAMQIATDNADKLIQELTLTYNKSRQQAITTELLDIMGGSMQ